MSVDPPNTGAPKVDNRLGWARRIRLLKVRPSVFTAGTVAVIFALALTITFLRDPITAVVSQAVGKPWTIVVLILALALVALLAIIIQLLFVEDGSDRDGQLQLFILVITVASFYAYGWPKEKPVPANWMSDLAVILILFLLSELAVNLTQEARKTRDSLKAVEQEEIAPLREQLKRISEELNIGKFSDAVARLGEISEFYRAIDELKDAELKRALVLRISAYASAWASILQGAFSANDELRIECFKILFDKYLQKIRDDIKADDSEHIRMPASADFYFMVLTDILSVFERAHTEKNMEIFVWAVTNALPAAFYHWGDEYGRLGSSPATDSFRQIVGTLAKVKNYRRVFLVSDSEQHNNRSRTAADWGVPLWYKSDLLSPEVLLLVGARGASPPTDDTPMGIGDWEELGIWNEILGKDIRLQPNRIALIEQRQGLIKDRAASKFYGIIKMEAFKEALGRWLKPEEANAYQLGSIFECEGKEGTRYRIKAVSLLGHFKEKYQSEDGMKILFVRSKDIPERHLPAGNPDCLIIGIKDRGTHTPVIALASRVDLSSDTLEMAIITDQRKLLAFKDDWEKVLWEQARPVTESMITGITAAPPLPAAPPHVPGC